jgi:hypothetical protein
MDSLRPKADHQPSPVKMDSKAGPNIASKKLVDEYVRWGNSKKAQELLQRKSGPPCPKCHSARAVVPIVYCVRLGQHITSNKPPVPWEYEDAYWCPHVFSNPPKQWYCLGCHMPFFDQVTGDPIYEHEDR